MSWFSTLFPTNCQSSRMLWHRLQARLKAIGPSTVGEVLGRAQYREGHHPRTRLLCRLQKPERRDKFGAQAFHMLIVGREEPFYVHVACASSLLYPRESHSVVIFRSGRAILNSSTDRAEILSRGSVTAVSDFQLMRVRMQRSVTPVPTNRSEVIEGCSAMMSTNSSSMDSRETPR